MTTLLICHEDEVLNRVGLARWLAWFSDLVGVVTIREDPGSMKAASAERSSEWDGRAFLTCFRRWWLAR